MINQTIIYNAVGYEISSGIAAINEWVDVFQRNGLRKGWINFHVHTVIITPQTRNGEPTDQLLFTVQIDFYVPEIM